MTSRIVGYNPDRLQNAGFRHFTIQSLETSQIHEFIDKWYDLAMPGENDRDRLKQRLKDAIANSKAIGNLADNLLLLTMMVILNRRQELPRDRSELYEQATRVLLHHWDVDHKLLQLKEESIGRREKQAMLRAVAYEMQTSDAGLKGNLITADRLTQVLTGYLREQGFEAPREKANGLIEQLRSRNWILCDRGADTYGFVHRTFLEYFCAMEIVHRFEKTRELTFEQLRDDVFGLHWQDETWHEVLRLICGAIDPHFVVQLIDFLIDLEIDLEEFLNEHWPHKTIRKEGFMNLIFATDCWSEIKSIKNDFASKKLSTLILEVIESPTIKPDISASRALISRIATLFSNEREIFDYLRSQLKQNKDGILRFVILVKLSRDLVFKDDLLSLVLECLNDPDISVRRLSAQIICRVYCKADLSLLEVVKNIAQDDKNGFVRHGAIEHIAEYFYDNPEIFDWLCCAAIENLNYESTTSNMQRERYIPRKAALEALLKHYPTHPKTIELLHDRALNDPDEQLREWATEQLRKLEGSD